MRLRMFLTGHFWELASRNGLDRPRDSARIVVCSSDLAVFQYPHELIWGEEKLTKGLVQHSWAQVLSGMGFSEGNNIRDTSRVHERSC